MRRRSEYGRNVLARIPEHLRDIPVAGMCDGMTPREFATDFDERERDLQPQCPTCVALFKDLAVWQDNEVWGAA